MTMRSLLTPALTALAVLLAGCSAPDTAVQVYFGNTVEDPGTLHCDVTYPVMRQAGTDTDTEFRAAEAINALLAGPTAQEVEDGYVTSIPDGALLRDLSIRDGVAYADFDEAMQQGVAGSCRVAAIRSQIESTLLRFPEVEQVVISVNGNTDEILQP